MGRPPKTLTIRLSIFYHSAHETALSSGPDSSAWPVAGRPQGLGGGLAAMARPPFQWVVQRERLALGLVEGFSPLDRHHARSERLDTNHPRRKRVPFHRRCINQNAPCPLPGSQDRQNAVGSNDR